MPHHLLLKNLNVEMLGWGLNLVSFACLSTGGLLPLSPRAWTHIPSLLLSLRVCLLHCGLVLFFKSSRHTASGRENPRVSLVHRAKRRLQNHVVRRKRGRRCVSQLGSEGAKGGRYLWVPFLPDRAPKGMHFHLRFVRGSLQQ